MKEKSLTVSTIFEFEDKENVEEKRKDDEKSLWKVNFYFETKKNTR